MDDARGRLVMWGALLGALVWLVWVWRTSPTYRAQRAARARERADLRRVREASSWPARARYTRNGVIYDPRARPGDPLYYRPRSPRSLP